MGHTIDHIHVEHIHLHWGKSRKRFSAPTLIAERKRTKVGLKVGGDLPHKMIFSQVGNSRNSFYFRFCPKPKIHFSP